MVRDTVQLTKLLFNCSFLLSYNTLGVCFQIGRIMCMTGLQGREAPFLEGTLCPSLIRTTVKVRLMISTIYVAFFQGGKFFSYCLHL